MASLDATAHLGLLHLDGVLKGRPVFLLAVSALLGYIVYQRYFSPLSKVPGPFLASFTDVWWLCIVLKRQQHLDSLKLHEKYGPLVRLGPNHVMVADPEAFKTIYGAGKNFQKSDFYKPFKAKLKWSLTAETDGHVHSMNRRMMQGLTGRPINLGDWLALFAIDSITEITFSKSFNYLDKGDADGILALSKVVFSSAAWVGIVPWVYRIHHYTSDYTGNWLGVTMRSIRFRALAEQKVKEHDLIEDENEDHKSILGYLKDVRRKKPEEFSEYAMISATTSNIFAGSDTTSIALRTMIYCLLSSPHYHQKFLSELEERREAGLISDPIRFSEAEAWPFLQAVMYEAIRLHPPFAVHLPRVVPESGLVAQGIYLPPGTVVGTNAWCIHRQKKVFGDDVNEFRPERWMDPEKKAELQRFFFGFGGGARTCLGRNIVWLEMSKFLPTLFMHYSLRLVDPTKPMPVKNIFLAFQDGPYVFIEEKRNGAFVGAS
ncbi:hypothetical protein CLAIMM_04305 [Cladophialophora immunda]|nr:hypothetical protein CLAIMM_04305 [Cladophialophora immunda]